MSDKPYSPRIVLRGQELNSPAYRWVRETDKIPALGTGSGDLVVDPIVKVKLFNPSGSWTWFITEYDPETGDAFGLVDGQEEELGYFNLIELADVRGSLGLPIERDLHWTPKPLSECYRKPA
jgi:hypothetical protein